MRGVAVVAASMSLFLNDKAVFEEVPAETV